MSMRGGRPPSKPTGMQMSVAVNFSGGEDFSSHVRKLFVKKLPCKC